MKVKSLGKNKTQIEINTWDEDISEEQFRIILVSYETPVAALIMNKHGVTKMIPYKTSVYYSVTTSKHINQWLESKGFDPKKAEQKDQSFFDNLMS